jgi:hypothetical protein
MKELLDWILENTYGYCSFKKFNWGGGSIAYSIAFHTITISRGGQHKYREYYGEIVSDMDLDEACKKALDKLKKGWLDKIGGDIIDGKLGARYEDGELFKGQMYTKK